MASKYRFSKQFEDQSAPVRNRKGIATRASFCLTRIGTEPIGSDGAMPLRQLPEAHPFGHLTIEPEYVPLLKQLGVPEERWQQFVDDLGAIVYSVFDENRTTLDV